MPNSKSTGAESTGTNDNRKARSGNYSDLLTQMDVLLEKNSAQIAQNSRNLNVGETPRLEPAGKRSAQDE